MGMIGALVLAIVVAVLSRLVADDVKAWSPRIAAWLIRQAVAMLPKAYQDRFREEWAEYISDTPGELTRLVAAAGFCVAGFRIQLAERRRLRRVEAREAVVRAMVAEHCFLSEQPAVKPFVELFAARLCRYLDTEQGQVLSAVEIRAQQLARELGREMDQFVLMIDSARRDQISLVLELELARRYDLPKPSWATRLSPDFLEALLKLLELIERLGPVERSQAVNRKG